MKRQFIQFLIRVAANAGGIFVAAQMLDKLEYQGGLGVLLISAGILSLVNAVVRPIVVIFSLPAYVITLGLFSVVVNALMLFLVDLVYNPFEVKGLLTAILAGIVIGLVNYILTRLFDLVTESEENE
jgi:putative membrane protein